MRYAPLPLALNSGRSVAEMTVFAQSVRLLNIYTTFCCHVPSTGLPGTVIVQSSALLDAHVRILTTRCFRKILESVRLVSVIVCGFHISDLSFRVYSLFFFILGLSDVFIF